MVIGGEIEFIILNGCLGGNLVNLHIDVYLETLYLVICTASRAHKIVVWASYKSYNNNNNNKTPMICHEFERISADQRPHSETCERGFGMQIIMCFPKCCA